MANPVIAVVNDDTAFLDLMHDLLGDEGYQTIIHRLGSTAYQKIRSEKPDLVILDIRLEHPENGWDILELMQLDPETTHIPVIVCSADAQALHEKAEWLQAHGIESLQKPFNLEDLLELVQRMVGSPPASPKADTSV